LAKDLKPVMFFIHGGCYATGNDPTYDGGIVVSRGDVVVVAINYPLISFDFLALDDGITNWVQDNIRDFGGDLDRITIFGQSSGAATVRAMLASPKAIGKFVAAIPQNNLGGLKDGTYSLYRTITEEASGTANTLLKEVNCTSTEVAS
jgi:carboxylesterase type B